jgi:hypothetical protein
MSHFFDDEIDRRELMGVSYDFTELPLGFRISALPHPLDHEGSPDWLREMILQYRGYQMRTPVSVRLEPCALAVAPDGQPEKQELVNLCGYRQLVTESATILMSEWLERYYETRAQWKEHLKLGGERDFRPLPAEWGLARTGRGIGKRVHAQWRRLLDNADPTTLAVHRRVFAATFGHRPHCLLFDPELYKQTYIVADLLTYRAAAAVLASAKLELEELANWRMLFCPEGLSRPYRALNKTLNELPAGVPVPLLRKLNQVVLPRPIASRTELIVTVLAGYRRARNFSVFAKASAAEIRECMRRLSTSRDVELSPRRTEHLNYLVAHLGDFPEPHRGNLCGLTDKAIRWHRRDRQLEVQQRMRETLGNDTPTALPPVPLPCVDGVRFLGTVGEVADEGSRMGHCIASFAPKAVEGLCYLFHVEFGGEQASVEVSPQGVVLQSQGPRDHKNAASSYGTRVLSAWASQFRTV